MNKTYITETKPGNITVGNFPEFCRVPNIFPLFGLKRGIVYRKINDGTFKSILVRERGNKTGIRLVFTDSVRAYLHGLLAGQNSTENGQQEGEQ